MYVFLMYYNKLKNVINHHYAYLYLEQENKMDKISQI